MDKHPWLMLAIVTVLVVVTGHRALDAAGPSIANPSFEDPALGDGGFIQSVDAWSATGPNMGTLNPAPGWFPAGIPDGGNVAWINGIGTLSQVLTSVLAANTAYRLEVAVGQRTDTEPGTARVELVAGNTVLKAAPATAAAGTFREVTVSYASGASHAELGKPLEIRLHGESPTGQINFDAVRLSEEVRAASPVSRTLVWVAGLALVVLALVLLAYRRRRRPAGGT